MGLLQVCIILIVIGFLLWLFNAYVTMIDGKVKQIINILVIVAIVVWLLNLSGVLGAVDVPFPRIR